MKQGTKGSLRGIFLLTTVVLFCPCHLPFTLATLAGLLAGTAAGAFINEYSSQIILASTLYFIGIVTYALYSLTRSPVIEVDGKKDPSPLNRLSLTVSTLRGIEMIEVNKDFQTARITYNPRKLTFEELRDYLNRTYPTLEIKEG